MRGPIHGEDVNWMEARHGETDTLDNEIEWGRSC